MLEQVSPGLFTMNMGNLLPGESIAISISYAELFKWRGNLLKFFVPTTIAPRYGDFESLDILPHQAPEIDLRADNKFTIKLSIFGALAGALLESPSHKIVVSKREGKAVVSLEKGQSLMDRDFVLNLVVENSDKGLAHMEPDGDQYIALASFYPRFPIVTDIHPRCVTIVVDCSASMNGDSMAQARKALSAIVNLLRPEDRFNVIMFGSSYQKLFPAPAAAQAANLERAKRLLKVMDADMGGTEIGLAVAAAIKDKSSEDLLQDVLLITDGQVWEWEKVTALAARSGFRFFTVGVGSSVCEAFVQALADETGGACELVAPNEKMAEKIVRHFQRIYYPRAQNVKVLWPVETLEVFPERISALYHGDTLHVFARFSQRPAGDVKLRAVLENGRTITQKLTLHAGTRQQPPDELPATAARVAAACQIRKMQDPGQIAALALKYQLMSRVTNYLAIDVKADSERTAQLPALRKVPHMLAVGWGGTGSVVYSYRVEDVCQSRNKPMFMRARTGFADSDLTGFVERLDRRFQYGLFAAMGTITSIDELRGFKLPEKLLAVLKELVNTGCDEEMVIAVFLYLLSRQKQFKKILCREVKRMIKKAYKRLPQVPDQVQHRIKAEIEAHLQQTTTPKRANESQETLWTTKV